MEQPRHEPQRTFIQVWVKAIAKVERSDIGKSPRWEALLAGMTSCKSAEEVCQQLEKTVAALQRTRGRSDSKWRELRNKYLKPAAETLLVINTIVSSIASSIMPGVPGGNAIFAVMGLLLEATKGVSERFEALLGLFEELSFFMDGLRVRVGEGREIIGTATHSVDIAILAHLLDTFFLASQLLMEPAWRARFTLFRRALIKDNKIKDALQRLRTLTELETRAMTAEISAATAKADSTISEIQDIIDNTQETVKTMNEDILAFLRSRAETERRSEILKKLDWVERADIDGQSSRGCLAGTRVQLLAELQSWSRDPTAPRIYWLNGMAGTGKSAIARSFCRNLILEEKLGGSFFCFRGGSDRERDVKHIIPTLSVSLASFSSRFKELLSSTVGDMTVSPYSNLELQLQYLLMKPLSQLNEDTGGNPMAVLVIDALDECSDDISVYEFLNILVRVAHTLPIKLFLTSRPEPSIRRQLERLNQDLGCILRLHDIHKEIVKGDIKLYLEHGLRAIPEISDLLHQDPTGLRRMATLAEQSGILFVYVSTVLLYLQRGDPTQRFLKLTSATSLDDSTLTKPIDYIYRLIVLDAINPEWYSSEEIELTKRVLAIIVTLYQPLSIAALAALMDIDMGHLKESLHRLYAVIYVPVHDHSGVLTTLHASFGEFLTIPGRMPEQMTRPISLRHEVLAALCIAQLSSYEIHIDPAGLYRDVNARTQQFTRLSSHLHASEPVDLALMYSCHHTHRHLAFVHPQSALWDILGHVVMGPNFLYMLELLAKAVDMPPNADNSADILSLLFNKAKHRYFSDPGLATLVKDASYSISKNKGIIRTSKGAYKSVYLPALSSYVLSSVVHQRNTSLPLHPTALVLSSDHLTSMVFSANCTQLVGIFKDRNDEICIWNTWTGKHVKFDLPRADELSMKAFPSLAANMDMLVTAQRTTYTNLIKVWEFEVIWSTQDPQPLATVEYLSKDPVTYLAVSHSGQWMAAGSDNDISVYTCDKITREMDEALKVSVRTPICSLTFSSTGLNLAAGLENGTICVWNTSSDTLNEPLLFLQECFGPSTSIIFSSDDSRMISGHGNTVVVWNVNSEGSISLALKLRGQSNKIESIAWHDSPGVRQILVASRCRILPARLFIHIWEAETGNLQRAYQFEGPTLFNHMILFSPDGKHLMMLNRANKAMHLSSIINLNPNTFPWIDILGPGLDRWYTLNLIVPHPISLVITPYLRMLLILDEYLISHIEMAAGALGSLAIIIAFLQSSTGSFPYDVSSFSWPYRLTIIAVHVVTSLSIALSFLLITCSDEPRIRDKDHGRYHPESLHALITGKTSTNPS